MTPKNSISFRVWGRYALFTDPVSKMGGEKASYQIPTYEAIKGVVKSIYWKPSLIWYIDKLRVLQPIQTETKGIRPIKWSGGNDLAYYRYLKGVEYQVQAHFEFNKHRPELADDWVEGKHFAIAKRSLKKGGRQDIFLGARECQAYVEPCDFGVGSGHYDTIEELGFGTMVHSLNYPDETGKDELSVSLWQPVMRQGVLSFPRPEEVKAKQFLREMRRKEFVLSENFSPVEEEDSE